MPTDTGYLGIEVDSRDLKRGGRDLDEFAGKGEAAARDTKSSSKKMVSSFKLVAAGIVAVVAVVATLSSSITTIASFETSVSKMGAVSRASRIELEAMRKVALKLGSTTEFSATQAADGLTFLAKAGFSATESMAAIPAVLDLATASGMGLAATADIASNVMSGFGVAAAKAGDVADILAAASSRSNTDVMQLGDAMKFVGPVASALGVSMSETAAAIGILSDAGIQGGMAGTSFRRVLSSLVNPTGAAKKAIKDLQVELEDVNPATNKTADIVKTLADAGLTAADALTIFGDRGGPAILALTSQTDDLQRLTGELKNVEDESKRMAETFRDNLKGDIQSFKSAVEGLILALGDGGLTGFLRGSFQGATTLTRYLTENLIPAFELTGVVIVGLGLPLAINLFATLTAGMTLASAATGVFAAAVRVANAAVVALGGPLGIVWGILGAGAAAWVLWGEKAGIGERSAYSAAEGTNALNTALGIFYETAGPTSAQEVVELASANYVLATSAYEAAKAEVAKNEAANLNPHFRPQYAAALKRLAKSEAALTEARRDSLRAAKAVTGAMSEGITKTIEAAAAEKKLSLEIKLNTKGLDLNSAAIDKNSDELTDAEKAAKSYADAMKGEVTSALSTVGDEFSKMITTGFEDFKGFTESIVDSFKKMIAQMISTAINNKITIGLGLGGAGGGAGSALASGLGGGGGGSGLLSSLLGGGGGGFGGGIGGGGGGGNGGAIFSSTSAAAGGAGLGSAFASGFAASLSGPTAGLAAVSGGLTAGAGAAGLATAVGALAVPALIVLAIVSFFKKTKKTLDSGLRVIVNGVDTVADSFKVIQTRKYWGLSKKVRTHFSALESEVSDPIEKSLNDLLSGIANTASTLGIGASTFDKFRASTRITTKGLSEDEVKAAVLEALTGIADNFAGLVPGLRALQKDGEGATAALTRLSTSLTTVNDGFTSLLFPTHQISLAGAAAASSFVDLFGTLDNFVASSSAYYTDFYTAKEQQTNATARLTTALEALGVNVLPRDRAGYRSLVDTAQSAGDNELVAGLIQLSPAFSNLTTSVDALSDALRLQVEERNYATGIDYARGLSRASNNVEYTPQASSAELLVELRALNARIDLLQSTSEITAASTGATAVNTEDLLDNSDIARITP